MKTALAIVIPCFNEEQVLQKTAVKLIEELKQLVAKGKISNNSFIYFVDDGSTDNSWEIIAQLHKDNPQVKGLKLSRNFGHQKALLAGLLQLKDKVDCTITIDADLQDDSSLIEEFIDHYRAGADVVYGVRKDRGPDSFLKRHTAAWFYKLLYVMGTDIIVEHADYRLASKRVLAHLAGFKEVNLFLRGIFPLIGFKAAKVYYERKARLAGQTKYTPLKMLGFALDGITSTSIAPLRLIAALGVAIFTSSLFMSIYIVIAALVMHKTLPGWASTVLPIYFIGGVQLLSIGIIGEYIGKIYQEAKGRPRFTIESELF